MSINDGPVGTTALGPEEMEGLRFPHVTTRGELDHLEQANIQEGLQWLARQKKPDLLQEAFLRELHRRLLGKVWTWAGTFRKTEKNIGVDPRVISVELRKLLDDCRYWVEHYTYPPTELAARFHHRLVKLHLFANGNGRQARIMADFLLTHLLDENPIDWAGGHDLQTMNERRKAYIRSLRLADGGDYKALLGFVGEDKQKQE